MPRRFTTPPRTQCEQVVWAPGPVWTGAENLQPTGIQSPDRQALASGYID